MEVDVRAPLKRPLSFSDDSFEWDSVRDEVPADVGWNSMKSDGDDSFVVSSNGLPVDWTPYGYVRGRKAKRQRLDPNIATATPPKRPRVDTVEKLEDESEREVASQILLSISKYSGSFVFESSEKDTYARLVPFPATAATTKMGANDDWQLDKFDCKLESLLEKSPLEGSRSISFPVWKDAKQRERKYEVKNVKREPKLEDVTLEDGTFSWVTFANIVKPQFVAMEPKARCAAAKQFSAMLQGDLSTTSETSS